MVKKPVSGSLDKTVPVSSFVFPQDDSNELFSKLKPVGFVSVAKDLIAARDELLRRLGLVDSPTGVSVLTEGLSNIVGVGCGLKQSGESLSAQQVIKVFVKEKLPRHRIVDSTAIDELVNGYATDVEVVGTISCSGRRSNSRFINPVPCGVSCGHPDVTAGTIGATVILDDQKQCILSNNHVIAKLATQVLDPTGRKILIYHPGPLDAKELQLTLKEEHVIGALERVVPIHFDRPNTVDAAVAHTDIGRLVSSSHRDDSDDMSGFDLNPEPMEAVLGATVLKRGRSTDTTTGVITAVGVMSVKVRYGAQYASFDDQIVVKGVGAVPFSKPGDSGSVIVDFATKRPVALLFAGSDSNQHTFGNSIFNVMRQLRIARFVKG